MKLQFNGLALTTVGVNNREPHMLSKLIPVIVFLSSLASNLTASEPNAALRAFSDGFADVAAKIKPSVVTVYSEKTIKLPQFRSPFRDGFPFQYF